MNRIATTCLACLLAASCAFGADWPQFHGPNRDAKSAETGLIRSFPSGGPKVLWTVETGPGYGGAAIHGGKVYVLDRPDSRSEALRCFDVVTGKEEWNHAYAAPGQLSHPGSRSTPAVDDKYVITVGRYGHVHCFDKATKKPVWTKHLLRDFGGGRVPKWGVAQSALPYKDNVVFLAPQTRSAGVVALARDTGKELWRSKSIGSMHYVAPRVITLGGLDQVVVVTGSGVSAVDASNGKVLWHYGKFTCRITIPNVTPIGDGRVFITAGYRAGSAMIKVTRTGEGFAVQELWKKRSPSSQMNPGMLLDGYLYVNANSNEASDGLMCLDLDGNVKWQTGGKLFERGHMMFADGRIWIIHGRTGALHLIEPSPKAFKEVAKAGGLLSGKEIWGPLALSDGKLVIRDQQKMICLDVKAP